MIINKAIKTVEITIDSRIAREMYESGKVDDAQKALYESLANLNDYFLQFRYLNKDGIEKLRFDYDKNSKKMYEIGNEALQNKANRYYFQEVLKAKDGDIWISNFDLNIKHNRIETPYVPTIRIGTPVYIDGVSKGVVIVNLNMSPLIEELKYSELFDVVVFDQENEILFSTFPNANEWSRYIGENKSDRPKYITKEEALYWHNGYLYHYGELYTHPNASEKLTILLRSKENLHRITDGITKIFIIALFILLPLNFILALLFSKTYTKLINNLEKKEKLLQQERKMAEIGGLMSYLAHQWRHLLNGISTTLMAFMHENEKWIYANKGALKDIKSLENKIEHMDEILEVFQHFYTYPKHKEHFFVADAIDEVLQILEYKITILQIEIIKNYTRDGVLFGRKSEWMQVLFSILQNILDIFQHRATLKPRIVLEMKQIDKMIQLTIQDNGGGIEKKILKTLFLPYVTTVTKNENTGIGLYFAKLIIREKYNGDIKALNNKDGALFVIECKKAS